MEVRKKKWNNNELQELENAYQNEREREKSSGIYRLVPVIYIKSSETGVYESWGIKNYGCKRYGSLDASQKEHVFHAGVLELPFPDDKVLIVENVSRVVITWGNEKCAWGKSQFAFLFDGICPIAPDLEEMPFLHFAIEIRRFDLQKNKIVTDCVFYNGAQFVSKIENIVDPIRNAPEGGVGITIMENDYYVHMVRTYEGILERTGLSKELWFQLDIKRNQYIRELINKRVQDTVRRGVYEYYFYVNESNLSRIFESYMLRNSNPVRVENFFPDDETKNYKVEIDVDDLDMISFITNYGHAGYAIYDVPIDRYLTYLPGTEEVEYFFASRKNLSFHEEVLNDALSISNYRNLAELQISIETFRFRSRECLSLINLELYRRLEPGSIEFKPGQYQVPRQYPDLTWYVERKQIDKEKYAEEKEKLISEDELNIRWKGEYTLFKYVRSLYSDAKYQYHASWLGQQSLDVFIPSLSIGLEYQGVQHYQPIDFFGGKEGFEHRQKLDEKKRRLCKEHGVSLIEWKYDVSLTVIKVEKEINKRKNNSKSR